VAAGGEGLGGEGLGVGRGRCMGQRQLDNGHTFSKVTY
jgi:hypothetical protein